MPPRRGELCRPPVSREDANQTQTPSLTGQNFPNRFLRRKGLSFSRVIAIYLPSTNCVLDTLFPIIFNPDNTTCEVETSIL